MPTSRASISSSAILTSSKRWLPQQPRMAQPHTVQASTSLVCLSHLPLLPPPPPVLVLPDQLLREARHYGQVTPLQVALLYQLCDMEHKRGAISAADFRKLVPRPSFAMWPPTTSDTSVTSTQQVCVLV